MKYFLQAFLIVFFTWLAFKAGYPIGFLFHLAAGLLLSNLSYTAYAGSKKDGTF